MSEVEVISTEIEISDHEILLSLTGPNACNLKPLERIFYIGVGLRGTTIRLSGPADAVALAERTLHELIGLIAKGVGVDEKEVVRVAGLVNRKPDLRVADMANDQVKVGNGRNAITPKGPVQQDYIKAIYAHDLTFGIGPAGTGKTYLAMAVAVSELLARKYKRIILTRPAVEAGEKLGFLPGDLAEKVNPYLRPLYDALNDMVDTAKAQELMANGSIEVAPLAFMRGRTLTNAFVILDEAQNTTADQMKMFLTRLGHGSKAVITGDVTQIDLPHNQCSGLADAVNLLRDVKGIAMSRFSHVDVVRHPLVAKIVQAYEARADKRAATKYAREHNTEKEPSEDDAAE
jgi:phosphate starvation-inducible PhoH-like protein